MSATIHPFRSQGFKRLTHVRKTVTPADPLQQSEALRSARQEIAEAWRLRVESAAIKQGYEERRARIELLLAGMDGVERA